MLGAANCWNHCRVDLLTDWKTLTAALEGDDDGGRGTGPLSAAALTNLLQVLRASVHKACGGTLVVTRQDARCESASVFCP